MASTLTCLFSFHHFPIPEHLHYLHDAAHGENVKKCFRADTMGMRDATLFLRIPPPSRGQLQRIEHSIALATTVTAYGSEIFMQDTVYVKWGMDNLRVALLRHEAGFYVNELQPLQGSVVPRLLGFYESVNKNEPFAISIFEHCFASMPFDYAEYQRRYIIAACKIHSVGIFHGQLTQKYVEEGCCANQHVFFDRDGRARIVDFTQATRHPCSGSPVQILKALITGECCDELGCLRMAVLDRFERSSAVERRAKDYLQLQQEEQCVDHISGPVLSQFE